MTLRWRLQEMPDDTLECRGLGGVVGLGLVVHLLLNRRHFKVWTPHRAAFFRRLESDTIRALRRRRVIRAHNLTPVAGNAGAGETISRLHRRGGSAFGRYPRYGASRFAGRAFPVHSPSVRVRLAPPFPGGWLPLKSVPANGWRSLALFRASGPWIGQAAYRLSVPTQMPNHLASVHFVPCSTTPCHAETGRFVQALRTPAPNQGTP